MKFIHYEYQGQREIGRISDDGATIEKLDVPAPALGWGLMTVVEAAANGGALFATTGETRSLAEAKPLAPFPKPRRNVFCVGKNYYDHAHEFSNSGFDSSAALRGSFIGSF